MKEKEEVHICVIADSGYAVPTAVMLTSAKINKHIESKYVIHYLSNGLSDFDKRKVMELSSADFRVEIQECNADRYKAVVIPNNATFTVSTMIKCELEDLLPHVDKVLMMDGDILVKGDLTELYTTELKDLVVAAVKDLPAHRCGIADTIGVKHYFNCGVLLLNLELMRREKLGDKIIQTKLQAPESWTLGEQDPFNWVCVSRLKLMPLKWNSMPMVYRRDNISLNEINGFYGTDYKSMRELEDDAVVMHFAAAKPWKNRFALFSTLWQKYYDMSPYGDTEIDYEEVPHNKYCITKVRLFGFVPILQIVRKEQRTYVCLPGGAKLFKLIRKNLKSKLLLFNLIPIMSWKRLDV